MLIKGLIENIYLRGYGIPLMWNRNIRIKHFFLYYKICIKILLLITRNIYFFMLIEMTVIYIPKHYKTCTDEY